METTYEVLVLVVLLFFTLYFLASDRYRFYTWYFVVTLLIFGGTVVLPGTEGSRLYFYVFLLGLLTAFAEIIGKFSDEPIKSLRTPHALFYFIFNGLIATFALYLIVITKAPGALENNPLEAVQAVMLAGFGSMLVMRSKLFSVRIGDQDVSVGPDQIINVFFRFMEAEIDRVRAQSRIDFITSKMNGIDFEKVIDYSVAMLESAPQSLEAEKMKNCAEEIQKLRSEKSEANQLKSYRLGFHLLDTMGEGFVSKIFDNAPPEWRTRAPMPGRKDEGLLDRIPLLSSRTLPYMAYGPNMSSRKIRAQLGWSDIEETIFHEATSPQKCVLKGYKLVFNKPAENSPAGLANIQSAEGEMEGVLYHLSKEAIDFLDINERGYRRIQVDEVTVDGKQVRYVQIYIAESNQDGLTPEREYLDMILEGAREYHLSQSYIATIQAALPVEEAENQPAKNATAPAAPANQSETTGL